MGKQTTLARGKQSILSLRLRDHSIPNPVPCIIARLMYWLREQWQQTLPYLVCGFADFLERQEEITRNKAPLLISSWSFTMIRY